jgi:hypothetical protein
MAKTILFLMASLVPISFGFCASLPDDPRTLPAMIITDAGTGSGCFAHLSNSVYLVTVKHVLFAPAEGTNAPLLLSPSAIIKTHSLAGTTNITERTLVLGLSQLMAAGEIRYSTNRDIAVVRVEDCDPTNFNRVKFLPGVAWLSHETGLHIFDAELICPISEVDIGAEVFMFGYPTSLTAQLAGLFDPTEPLLRKGIVAGINLPKKVIIIDCPAYFGNSGGPVLQVEHRSLTETKFRLIGLVSSFIPFQEEWENKTMRYSHVLKSNSGYTVIEPIDIALDLVWK